MESSRSDSFIMVLILWPGVCKSNRLSKGPLLAPLEVLSISTSTARVLGLGQWHLTVLVLSTAY